MYERGRWVINQDTDPVLQRICNSFVLLYTSDFDPENPEWVNLLSTIETQCDEFEKTFQGGSQTNYPHVFGKHTKAFIEENGSLRYFSNTILETLLATLKKLFLTKTSRFVVILPLLIIC